MTGLVEDLLLLARLDEGRPLQSAEVDLAALVAEAVWDARAAGGGHDWQLELSLDAPGVGRSATRHGCTRWWPTCWPTRGCTRRWARGWWRRWRPPRSAVSSASGTTARASRPPSCPEVFERFTRADTSRSRTDAGPAAPGSAWPSRRRSRAPTGAVSTWTASPGHTEFTIDLPAADDPVGSGGGPVGPDRPGGHE